jgi:hypothetical protein
MLFAAMEKLHTAALRTSSSSYLGSQNCSMLQEVLSEQGAPDRIELMVHRVVHTAGLKRSPSCLTLYDIVFPGVQSLCVELATIRFPFLLGCGSSTTKSSRLSPLLSPACPYNPLSPFSLYSPKDHDFSQSDGLPSSSTEDHASSKIEGFTAGLQLYLSCHRLLWQEQPCSLNLFVQSII